MSDPFASTQDSIISPARQAFPIVADDANDLPVFTKAIYVGVGGNIALRAVGSDADVTLANLPSGSVLAIRCRAIRSAGTSASGIVGLA